MANQKSSNPNLYKTISEHILKEDDPFKDILGQNEIKQQLKSTLLAKRHMLIIGSPGIGKTTLAKNLSKLLGKKEELFVRIQGSPDLTAEDLIGDIDPTKALKFGPLSMEAFTKGKIFKANNGILFFDELNRCPEKLQNALLQVLQERKATIGSYDVDLEANFIFIATMNPEDTSTEPLSDVLLDRFDVIYMSYPENAEVEVEIVKQHGNKIEGISFPDKILFRTVEFVRSLRNSDKLEKFPSVRATLGLFERAQANALLAVEKQVNQKHVEDAILSVLSHRIKLKPSVQYLMSPKQFVEEKLKEFMGDEAPKKEAGQDP